MEKSIIKRDLLEAISAHLSEKEITLISGPRQVGKTTIMRMLEKKVVEAGTPTLFLNMDIENDKEAFVSQDALQKKMRLAFGDKRGVAFLDEIQRKENAGLFLKGLYDMNLPYKMVISGSGSIELKEKIPESLMGRKRVFDISSISFREFVNFETEYRYDERLDDFFSLEKEKTLSFLSDYMNFGGYPRVVLEKEAIEKNRALDEIYQSYVDKDIRFLGVEKIDAFNNLLKLLASQIGNPVNYTELSNTLNISAMTVRHYLWFLEKTYIIEKVTPYARNMRKEISKAPIWYFGDCGFRNYALRILGRVPFGEEGFLFQNIIFLLLKEKLEEVFGEIHYWRTIDGAEVDFVVEVGREILPIEVKYKSFERATVERSLRSFIEKYSPKRAIVVNKNYSETITIGGTEVMFVPFNEFVRKDFKLV